jgi:hypothetical protein
VNGENNTPDTGLPPVFPSGLTLGELDLAGGAGFWDEVTRFTALTTLDEVLDRAAGGKPVPRVWAVLDEAENTAARTAAALALARTMSQRDQKVLVLDADDQHPDLTRWAGRSEQEGWIDFVRYGASLSSCSQRLPWEGRSALFMGIGSFWPTQIEPAEVEKLVARLRRQVDDLIITAPLTSEGLVWARQATMCLLCWDRLLRSTQDMQTLLRAMRDEGPTVSGIIGFGLDEAEILDSVLKPVTQQEADATAAPVPPTPPEGETAIASPEKADDAAEREETGAEATVASSSPPDRHHRAERRQESVASSRKRGAGSPGPSTGADESRVNFPRRAQAGQRTSPIFWAAAAVLVAVCAVIIILWVRMQSIPATDREPTLAQQAPATDISQALPESTGAAAPGSLASASLSPPAGASDPSAAALTGDAEPDPGAASYRQEPPGQADTLVRAEGSGGDGEVGQESGEPAGEPEVPSSATEPAATAQQEAAPTDSDSPFSVPVGQAGWAIHLYSLPDEASTVAEAAVLERKGFRATWRLEEVPGKGRYYRIYVGSFASAAAAKKALPEVKDRLRVKWAQVRRF